MNDNENKNMIGSTIQRAAPIQRAKNGEPAPIRPAEPQEQPSQQPPASAPVAPVKKASEVGKRTSKYRNVVADNYKQAAEPTINSPYAVMPVGWNYGFLFIFAIPIIGFFIAVVWAAGGTRYHNKRNLSIAYVFLQLTFILLLAIGFLVLYTVAEGKLDLILSNIKSIIDMFIGLFK